LTSTTKTPSNPLLKSYFFPNYFGVGLAKTAASLFNPSASGTSLSSCVKNPVSPFSNS